MEFYPEKRCVTGIISKYESDLINLSDLNHILRFINDNGLKINGDCMGRLLLREVQNGDLLYYFAFHIPIE